MEQWVSDTFYSYFPGFNMDYKQSYQRKDTNNQTNMESLKLHTASKPHSRFRSSYHNERENESTASNRSISSNDSESAYYRSKSTIDNYNINNVNYVPAKYSNRAKPGTARYKLLQDLYHSKLADIINGNGPEDINAEYDNYQIQSARKKEYQNDLISQIEEKRRNVKHVRENERIRDEYFTRNLLKNLQAMQLRDYLDIGDIPNKNAPRMKCDVPLLSLKNDIKLPDNFDKVDASGMLGMHGEMNKENIQQATLLNNKVYKYFSNYQSGRNINAEPSVCTNDSWHDNVALPPVSTKAELECFHLNEKICPNCDAPLKAINTNNNNYCLRCQNHLCLFSNRQANKSSASKQSETAIEFKENSPTDDKTNEGLIEKKYHNQNMQQVLGNIPMFICESCNRFYSFCSDCLSKSDVCRACQRQKNVCMNCRRKLCVFCLEEVACGKDVEQQHVNEEDVAQKQAVADELINVQGKGDGVTNESLFPKSKNIIASLAAVQDDIPSTNFENNNSNSFYKNAEDKTELCQNFNVANGTENNLNDLSVDDLNLDSANESNNIYRLRQQNDKKLMRYLKNYGDLALNKASKTTQQRTNHNLYSNHSQDTTKLFEELTIPILHEMPKLKRDDTKYCFSDKTSDELKNLNNRWEIPAVQKYLITPSVLTEVGAIRKQLQVDRFLSKCKD